MFRALQTAMRDFDPTHLLSRWIYLQILGLLSVPTFLFLSSEILGLPGLNELAIWGHVLAAATLLVGEIGSTWNRKSEQGTRAP